MNNSGLALFFAGFLMVLAAVLVPQGTAATTALILIGAAVMLIGGLLPRLAGNIKITPASIELPLLEHLEATRQEAVERAPEYVQEAVGRAFEELLPQLQALSVLPMTADAQSSGQRIGLQRDSKAASPRPKAARPISGWWKALAATSLVGVGLLLGIGLLSVPETAVPPLAGDAPPESRRPAPGFAPVPAPDSQAPGGKEFAPEEPNREEPAVNAPAPAPSARAPTIVVLVAIAVGLSLITALAWTIVRRRRPRGPAAAHHLAPPLTLETPGAFAQRIVDNIAGRTAPRNARHAPDSRSPG